MYQKVEYLTALPAKCFFCGGTNKEWYLDTSYQIEYYGAFVICNECIQGIGNYLGFCTQEQAAQYRDRVSQLEDQVLAQEQVIESLDEAIGALRKALRNDNPLHSVFLRPPGTNDSDSVSSETYVPPFDISGPREEGTSGSSDDQNVAGLRPVEDKLDLSFGN